MESPDDRSGTSALDAAVFLDELLLLAVLAAAGARLANGLALAVCLAIVLPAVDIVLWGRWLAPRAARRLRPAPRLAAKLTLVTVASALLAVTGAWVLALAFLVVSVTLITAGELPEVRRG